MGKIKKRLITLSEKRYFEWLVFGLVVLVRMALNTSISTLHLLPDEFGAIAGGAYFAGYDWSGIASSSAYYYGFGQGILYAPFIYFVRNVWVQYQCILAVNAVLQTIPLLICYRLMTRYYGVKDKLFAALAGAAASFFVATRSSLAMNEHVLILTMWVLVYTFTVNISEKTTKSKKMFASLLGVLAVFWSLLTHTRALTIVAGVVIVAVFCLVIYRKWVISPYVLVIGLITAILLSNFLISYVQDAVYLAGEQEGLNNTADSLLKGNPSLREVLTPAYLWQGLGILSGNIYAVSSFSGMFMNFALVAFIMGGVNMLWRFARVKNSEGGVLAGWNLRTQTAREYPNSDLYPGVILCAACGLGVMLFLTYSWMPRDGYPVISGAGARAFFYLRYYLSYMPPLIMYGFVLLDRRLQHYKAVFLATLVSFLVFKEFVSAIIVPMTVSTNNWHIDAMYWMAPLSLRKVGENLHPSSFIMITAVTLLVFGLTFWAYKKNKLRAIALVLLLLYFYQYSYGVLVIEASDANRYRSRSANTLQVVEQITQSPTTVYSISSSIYESIFQYHLQEYQLLAELPETPKDMQDSLLITTSPLLSLEVENMALTESLQYITVDGFYIYFGERYTANIPAEYEIFDGNAYILAGSSLYGNELALNLFTSKYLLPGGLLYGPYLNLPAGYYSVQLEGASIPPDAKIRVTADSGATEINPAVLEIDDTYVYIEFELEEPFEQVEFLITNTGDDPMRIDTEEIAYYSAEQNVKRR